MTEQEEGLVKIIFRLDADTWHGSVTESIWAEPVGPNRFRIRNVPFYAFGVSLEDIVLARECSGTFVFESVVTRSGHSTCRLLLNGSNQEAFDAFWFVLAEQGCTYEGGPPPLLAVDIPPEADIHKVYATLQEGEDASVWSFEEGHVGHRV